jgi:ATP-dependent DNA helicase RecQ
MFVLERDELYQLRRNDAEEDAVITALLRNYSGLFNNYAYIDEALLAQETGLSQPVVYLTLRALTEKHILSFIPQKRIPYIRYKQRREDSQYIQIPSAIYEDLRQRMSERIEAMISYVSTDNECRSRQLLRYFGETRTDDCHQCDVCKARRREEVKEM